ncbi:MAG: geranylgeranylglycerol-phosphate geranylgeranyltransferase [Candidatus Bathyarchaeia archaeon]
MGDLGGPLRLIRPINCIMVGFAIIVGAAIGAGSEFLSSWRSLILGFATGFTLTGSAMAINDYYDREIDAINEPGRPIPSGAVTPTEALAVSIALSSVGLLAAWATSPVCLGIAVFSWAVMMFYSTRGKRTGFFGNLLVSTCIAVPFIYGAVAVENAVSFPSLLFVLMAFLSNTGREITKGIVDVEGDRSKGVRTVAVSKGVRTAASAAATIYLSAVFVSLLPIPLGLVSFWYVPFVALTDVGLVVSSYVLLRNPSQENSRSIKNRALIWMMSGLIGFLVGSLP